MTENITGFGLGNLTATREYEENRAQLGMLHLVNESVADAMRDELLVRIGELVAENAALRKQNEVLATARRLEEESREQAEATAWRLYGMDATTGSAHVGTTCVDLVNDVVPPDRVEDGDV